VKCLPCGAAFLAVLCERVMGQYLREASVGCRLGMLSEYVLGEGLILHRRWVTEEIRSIRKGKSLFSSLGLAI
jgi:hypothetical protein